jgi:phosphatidylinositol alpha-1,6-mannosyltransferase
MERLNLQLARELSNGNTLEVVGPIGSAEFLPENASVIECALKPLSRFLVGAFFATLRSVLRQRPSFVIAGSGLCAPYAWIAARLCGARSGVYLHGLDIVARSLVYQNVWLRFIRNCDVCIVNSHNTASLARDAGISSDRIHVIHPGVHIPEALPESAAIEVFRHSKEWVGRRVLLSVGRLTERKGLIEFVESVLPLIVARYPDVLLVVIGNDAPDALHRTARSVLASVQEKVAGLNLEANVSFYGEVSDAEVANAYAAADVAVFPVRHTPGDVEGFGMVAIEAAAYGLPTVAFAVGGVPDAVSNGISGFLVNPGDNRGFADAVCHVLAAGRGAFEMSSRTFASGFKWSAFGKRVREIAERTNGR